MSFAARPDRLRRCFRPCYPGQFCACQGRVISDPREEARRIERRAAIERRRAYHDWSN